MSDHLKSTRRPAQPSRIAALFPRGSCVRLKACPDAEPGRVRGISGTRITVRWADLDYVGSHRPQTLELVEDEKEC